MYYLNKQKKRKTKSNTKKSTQPAEIGFGPIANALRGNFYTFDAFQITKYSL